VPIIESHSISRKGGFVGFNSASKLFLPKILYLYVDLNQTFLCHTPPLFTKALMCLPS